jgi:hypothetical protein|tara:strand:+ start:180 stop:521 length:342 start_codon:yes stop_codon:yes gene_type:complete
MPNTFKLATKLNMTTSGGTAQNKTIYTTPSSTRTVIIGMTFANTSGSSITVTVLIENSDGDNITFLKGAPIPSGGSLEIMSGNKLILETSDVLKAYASASTSCDCALSYMEIA